MRRSLKGPSTSKQPSKSFHEHSTFLTFIFLEVFLRRFSVCREIVDNHEKENALNIVTDERTYQVFAESPEDAR